MNECILSPYDYLNLKFLYPFAFRSDASKYWQKTRSSIFSPLIASADSCSFFFLCSSAFFVFGIFTCSFMWFIKLRACVGCVRVCMGVWGYAQVCMGVRGHVRVCSCEHRCVQMCLSLCSCVQVCARVCGCVHVCVCVQREFSEFLLENRVLISVDFYTHPIRIFRL